MTRRTRWAGLAAVLALATAAACAPPPKPETRYRKALTAQSHQNHRQAFVEFRALAEQGHASSQYFLGRAYANGDGVEQDYGHAAQWYMRAADQGLREAQFTLGVMYRFGTGLAADPIEARYWLRQAADRGHALAQLHFAEMVESEAVSEYALKSAYAFSLLASEALDGSDRDRAERLRVDLARRLPEGMRRDAEERARRWRPLAGLRLRETGR